jgi:hypothetical protein
MLYKIKRRRYLSLVKSANTFLTHRYINEARQKWRAFFVLFAKSTFPCRCCSLSFCYRTKLLVIDKVSGLVHYATQKYGLLLAQVTLATTGGALRNPTLFQSHKKFSAKAEVRFVF